MKRKRLMVIAFTVVALSIWWLLIPRPSGQEQFLRFAVGPVFYSNDIAMCSVVVSNASSLEILLVGNAFPETYIITECFVKGVLVEDKSLRSGEPHERIPPHGTKREEIKIPQGADALRVGTRRIRFTLATRLYGKISQTPINFLCPILVWKQRAELRNNNPWITEWSDVSPLRYAPRELSPNVKPPGAENR